MLQTCGRWQESNIFSVFLNQKPLDMWNLSRMSWVFSQGKSFGFIWKSSSFHPRYLLSEMADGDHQAFTMFNDTNQITIHGGRFTQNIQSTSVGPSGKGESILGQHLMMEGAIEPTTTELRILGALQWSRSFSILRCWTCLWPTKMLSEHSSRRSEQDQRLDVEQNWLGSLSDVDLRCCWCWEVVYREIYCRVVPGGEDPARFILFLSFGSAEK